MTPMTMIDDLLSWYEALLTGAGDAFFSSDMAMPDTVRHDVVGGPSCFAHIRLGDRCHLFLRYAGGHDTVGMTVVNHQLAESIKRILENRSVMYGVEVTDKTTGEIFSMFDIASLELARDVYKDVCRHMANRKGSYCVEILRDGVKYLRMDMINGRNVAVVS